MAQRAIRGICGLLLAGAALAADPHWIRIESPNFEMYSSASERGSRETLRYFEQIHGFFAQAFAGAAGKQVPVRIVAFSSKKEYEPYRFNEFAVAYYHAGAERDYIVLSDTGMDTFPIAVHEYVHLVVQHAGLKIPPWFSEGFAELYSTLKPEGDKILVGSLVEGRRQALLREKWVPLATILAVDRNSPYYNEKNKAGSLYNEGWALTHMLALSKEYRPGFSSFTSAINSGTPSVEALQKVYGKPLAIIEKDLQAYLAGSLFQGVLFPLKLEKVAAELPATIAPSFDVKLILTELLSRPERQVEARRRLEELAVEDPKRPEPHTALGYLALHTNQQDEARDRFAKAFELGSRNPRMLWDFGRLAYKDPKQAAPPLAALLKLEPDRIDARLQLASVQLATDQPREALSTLAPVKKVTPEDATGFFRLMAYAQAQAGYLKEARDTAERLVQVAKTDQERTDATRLLETLKRSTAPPPMTRVDAGVAGTTDGGRPRLVRRESGSEVTEAPQPLLLSTATVAFVNFDCSGPQPKVVVKSDAGSKTFLIDDPKAVLLKGAGGVTVELQCGPQKPTKVRIEYEAPSPGKLSSNAPGIEGLVRGIIFEK